MRQGERPDGGPLSAARRTVGARYVVLSVVLGSIVAVLAGAVVFRASSRDSLPPARSAGPAGPPPLAKVAPCNAATFGVDRWPSACWRPYAPTSPFNRRLVEPALAPDSTAFVARLMAWGGPQNLVIGNAGQPDDWGHPVYWSSPSDPVVTVDCHGPWGACPIHRERVRIPAQARAAGGSDRHLTVVDQRSGLEWDFYGVRQRTRTAIRADFGGRIRIDGSGLNSHATAGRIGSLAGIIRAPELEAGRIDHALFMSIPCDAGRHVFPASKGGLPCETAAPSGSDIPLGTRFQLAMAPAEIDALPVAAWMKTILKAMSEYGMIVGDTGGQSWSVQLESGATYTSFRRQDRLVTFAATTGIPGFEGRYVLSFTGVDWANRLRVVAPCESKQSC